MNENKTLRCLAIDIGASSGRHILGEWINGEIKLTEIYRFENGIHEESGSLFWDLDHLKQSVLDGIKKCGEMGIYPQSVAIDTWGVDYVLTDCEGKTIGKAISYRDPRTEGIPEEMAKILPQEKLYSICGLQKANYNTIYQLYCDKKSGKMEKASDLFLMPEYLSYCLCGKKMSEYTIASTTALLDAEKRDWSEEILDLLGYKKEIFHPIAAPGTALGGFTDEVKEYVGFDSTVLFAPAHDTASAVASCEFGAHGMYISSGTWSLIGSVNRAPMLTKEAMAANFTNEGGVDGTYRFLKNIMGMWLFQSIRKDLGKKYSYDEMMNMAMESSFSQTFNPNDSRLVAPKNMPEAIRACLGIPELPIADVLKATYLSLATSYANVVKEIEEITGEEIDGITIVGGGSKDKYLNRLTEEITGKKVSIGSSEATSLGNLRIQFRHFLEK